ncbi:leucine-rich repeat-containing protein 4-like [Sipha flava]|uniref:Leucine-rich repeat-containing protein 4-like n=1 Tax=Sipha flava TaxID=143950 RepID=A0A8B8GR76_9HEMI|nr:leucine-rich repeat-containing protein 4-like [Sipha flava]XP_025425760.1 leucine-rich repeat-containing protein 4-like [Sipha flava]XP_025425762.1 leucine-rich repeat-containing protein 4-like [Sipha flava]XP_025425763.1 leucine-rich repeat-containing protein 4-like [Sipha flava]XP_025425764.1 leucine-rich repeat-containing protein 4-like [Sipha flava]
MVLWTTRAMMMMIMMMTTMTIMTTTVTLRTSVAAAPLSSSLSSSTGCPAGCACKWKNGKQTVECVGKKVTGVTAALGIDPATQVLDISDNDLSAAGLPRDMFAAAGLSNLQRIHAARCNVYYVHDRAFYGLTNLVDLDLSGNCLRHVPTAAFVECPSLMKLSLSGNPIAEVPARAFRHLGQLTALDLSGCGLTAVAAGAFDDLAGLDWLKLDDNRLTHVPGLHTLPTRLHQVDLHRNDWQCDCRAADMHRWLSTSRVPVAEEPVCSGPATYVGVLVRRVPAAELACAPVVYPDARHVQDVAEGANVSFRCLVAATPVATVEWLFGGAPVYRHNASELITVDGNTTAELYVYNASLSDAGTYSCVAENRAGRAEANFTVTMRPSRPSLAAGAVDDRSAPSQSSSAAAGGNDGHSLVYVAYLAAGLVALSAATAVAALVAVRCKRVIRDGGRTGDSAATTGKRRPVAPAADGYRAVSTTADKEPLADERLPTASVARTTTAASVTTSAGAAVTTTAKGTAGPAYETGVVSRSNPDVVSDAKCAGWEIDFEQIVWAECPPATGYVSIQIPVQCGIDCLGAYYATTAAEAIGIMSPSPLGINPMPYSTCSGATGTIRRQHRRAAVLAAYDDTVQVRTTAQGGYPTAVPAVDAFRAPPSIVVDDGDCCGSMAVAPIISPPLPFRSATSGADNDDNDADTSVQDANDSIAL